MKKKTYILLAFVMIFGLFCGCSSAASNEMDETTLSTSESTTYEVTTVEASIIESSTEQTSTTTKNNSQSTTSKGNSANKSNSSSSKNNNSSASSTTSNSSQSNSNTTNSNANGNTTSTSSCANGSHSIQTGNSGKWFNSRSEAINYYNSVSDMWNNKFDAGEISYEQLHKNCPGGYECWSCSYCGKWTINFKYR